MANIIAVDFHRRYQKVLWLQTESGEIQEVDLKNNPVKEVEKFYRQLEGETTVGLEVSGYSMWFEDLVEGCGHELKLFHPGMVARQRARRQKNDRRDVQLLLEILLDSESATVWRGNAEQREQKMLIRHCVRLKRERTKWINVLRAMVYNYNLPIKKGSLSRASVKKIAELEMTPRRNQLRDELLQRIGELTTSIRSLQREIDHLASGNEAAQRLQTIPGIGSMTALYVTATVGPVERFERAKSLVCYVGLDSKESSSDNRYTRRRYGSISKQGDRTLRWLLQQCATTASRYNPELKGFYKRLTYRRDWRVARTALARKLLVTCYILLRDEIDYSEFVRRGSRVGSA